MAHRSILSSLMLQMASLTMVSTILLVQACGQNQEQSLDLKVLSGTQKQIALAKVDRVMVSLGIKQSMKTNPKVIKDLLREMKLANFNPSLASMDDFLNQAKSTPQPLAPLLDAIREGVTEHPAIMDFIDVALKNHWFSEFSEIPIVLNQIYLMEALTVAMANNGQFLGEIQDHILKERSIYGIMPHSTFSTFVGIFRSTNRFFDAVKVISVDPAITYNRYLNANGGQFLTAEQVQKLDDKQLISFAEKQNLLLASHPKALSDFRGLVLNIYEAAVTEYGNGFVDNAYSGHVLVNSIQNGQFVNHVAKSSVFPKTIDNPFYRSLAETDNFYLKDRLPQSWINLYESWNMSFILSELKDLQILFPKLLIPSVLSAKQGDYLYTRVIALWLSINHYTMRRLDQVPQLEGPLNRAVMANAWGVINKKYANQLIAEQMSLSQSAVEDSFAAFFRRPNVSLMKEIAAYICRPLRKMHPIY